MKAIISSREELFRGFVHEWIEAWNEHSIDRVMSHYAEDVVVRSPFLLAAAPVSGGIIHGREELRSVYSRAFSKYPELHFQLISYFVSTESVVILYRSVEDLVAAETLHLDQRQEAKQVFCHYSTESGTIFAAPGQHALPG
jgi:hypothetical protein